MADNFLEKRQQDYEIRKAAWIKNKSLLPMKRKQVLYKTRKDEDNT